MSHSHTFLQSHALLSFRCPCQSFDQTSRRSFWQGYPEQKAVHRIYRFVVTPVLPLTADRYANWEVLTLYAAAYPNPGNNDRNRVGTAADALSLKMMVLRCDADVTWSKWS